MACIYPECDCPVSFPEGYKPSEATECPMLPRRSPSGGETIEEQRKVEGFGDPQYTCPPAELVIRRAIYIFLQQQVAAGAIKTRLEQDWQGNTLHVEGSFRPMLMARMIAEEVAKHAPDR